MRYSLIAAANIAHLESILKARGLRCGKAFRFYCGNLRYDAALKDLENIHQQIAKTLPKTWADIADEESSPPNSELGYT